MKRRKLARIAGGAACATKIKYPVFAVVGQAVPPADPVGGRVFRCSWWRDRWLPSRKHRSPTRLCAKARSRTGPAIALERSAS